MDFQTKFDLIKDNLAEIIGENELVKKLQSDKPLRVYWGTSPTGKPHIGYFLPLIKIAQLVKAGCEVTILFADLHAYLDAMKTTWELLDLRTQYYEIVIKQILLCLQVDLTKIKFIKGSDFQLSKEYTIDVYKFMSKITVDAAQKGGAEVVKQSDNPALSGLAYPLLQVLDEVYLNSDAELGGQDQRKIFMLSRDHIHKLGYSPSIHLMNPMIPSITAKNVNSGSNNMDSNNLDPNNLNTDTSQTVQPEQIDKYIEQINKLKSKNLSWDNFVTVTGKIASDLKDKNVKKTDSNKMSSSDVNSKIDFLEPEISIRKKISKAFAEPTNTSNTLFLFLQYVVFPINKLVQVEKFIIERDEKYGGMLEYTDLELLKLDYVSDKLSPPDLKQGISDWLVKFLEPVRNHFMGEELVELVKKAYN
jgi:tyrosyl-tRNA synthetase